MTLVRAAEIMRNTVSVANAKEYARIVVERSKARIVNDLGKTIIDLASQARPMAEIIAEVQEAALSLNAEDDERCDHACRGAWAGDRRDG